MSRIACASLDVMTEFASRNYNFCCNINDETFHLDSAVNSILQECYEKINAYKSMLAEAESLVAKAEAAVKRASAECSAAQSALSSTPKTLKKTTVNSEGEVSVKEVLNPAYGAAQAAAQKAQGALSAAKSAVSEINSVRDGLKNKYNSLMQAESRVQNAAREMNYCLKQLAETANGATISLNKALAAIDKYLNVRLK